MKILAVHDKGVFYGSFHKASGRNAAEVSRRVQDRRYVTDLLRQASLRAGFQEYDGPVMEPLSLFAAKSGGELVERQSYSFADRSGREVILRPEMTPSLARMVSARGELQLPVRWFSMPLCYRYERPRGEGSGSSFSTTATYWVREAWPPSLRSSSFFRT